MSAYALSVVGTVLLSAILTMLVPEGKCSALIKGVAKLACVVVLIAPIPQYLKNDNFFDLIRGENVENTDVFFEENGITADESFIRYYCELRIAYTQKALEVDLQDKYAVSATVSLEWEFVNETDVDGLKITKIIVKTDENTTIGVKNDMTKYLSNTYCSEVQIE